MSTVEERNKALIRDFLVRLDAGDRDVVREVYSPGVVFHFPGSPPMDFDAVLELVDTIYTAFPDFTHRIDDLIAEGEKVVLRVTDFGTHQGEYEGMPPTGKEVSFSVIAIFEIRDGRVVEVWEELDMLGFLKQVGAIPELTSMEA